MVLMLLRSTILDLGFLVVGGVILYAITSISLMPARFFVEQDPNLSYPGLTNETVNTVRGGWGRTGVVGRHRRVMRACACVGWPTVPTPCDGIVVNC